MSHYVCLSLLILSSQLIYVNTMLFVFSDLWEATAFSYGRERVAIASTVLAVFDGFQTQELLPHWVSW